MEVLSPLTVQITPFFGGQPFSEFLSHQHYPIVAATGGDICNGDTLFGEYPMLLLL
jgi:hypothetical protein